MQPLRALIPFLIAGAVPLGAVYAPIPEPEQGKAWAVTLTGNIYQDSNIFGAPTGEIDSMVYSVSPQVAFNASLTQQTFLSASYKLALDYIEDRPGDSTVDSHDLSLRLAHAFRPGTTIDFTETFQISRNPESLLAGVALNTDQSFRRNQFDGRFDHTLNPKLVGSVKARAIHYAYDNDTLADSLDRAELLFGLSGAYALLPETKVVGEYRFQDVAYDTGGAVKDKDSHFLLVGVDYAPGPKLTASARVGAEFRSRAGESGEDAPYVELSGKYDYAEQGFVSAGYVYTLEETSNVALYTDTQVHRLFANVQHAFSPALVGSGSLNYEPSTLQGRRSISPDRDETTVRFGLALTYMARRNWSVSATADFDDVSSDDVTREMDRSRYGVSARYQF
ncbi:MAG TPA: outer membrane beta-barrel protein [Opitutaceae bacterium]